MRRFGEFFLPLMVIPKPKNCTHWHSKLRKVGEYGEFFFGIGRYGEFGEYFSFGAGRFGEYGVPCTVSYGENPVPW